MKLHSYVLFIHLQLTDFTFFLALQTLEIGMSNYKRREGPEACEGHNKTVICQRLFIFGGCGKSTGNNNKV
jgi:hypothetical protein